MKAVWLKVKHKSRKDLVVGVVYRQPQGNVKTFTDLLTETVNKIRRIDKSDIFIIGDFNVNYEDVGNQGRKLLNDMESLTGLRQLIRETTRYSSTKSTIDLIFTNSNWVSDNGTFTINISDHEPIYVTRKKEKERIHKTIILGR